jgi:hypothetical protein
VAHPVSSGGAATALGGVPSAVPLADAPGASRPSILGARPLDANSGQGHGEDLFHRGLAPRDPSVPASNPGTGMINFQTPFHLRTLVSDSEMVVSQLFGQMGQANPSL